jgi:hypothetical protein
MASCVGGFDLPVEVVDKCMNEIPELLYPRTSAGAVNNLNVDGTANFMGRGVNID